MGGMIGELKEFKYDLIINGKVMLTEPVANRSEFTKLSGVLSNSNINKKGEYVSIFDRLNTTCTYLDHFSCQNDYPARSITSIIKKNG
jgi:hypothetical protein